MAKKCEYLLEEKRRGTETQGRCRLKIPAEWNGFDMSCRWILNGGSYMVFGICHPEGCLKRKDK
jgi:hypothetical protein